MKHVFLFVAILGTFGAIAQDSFNLELDSPYLIYSTDTLDDGYVDTLFSIAGVQKPGLYTVYRSKLHTRKVVSCGFEKRGGQILPVGKLINYYPTGYNKSVALCGIDQLPNEGTFEVGQQLSPNGATKQQVYLINGEFHTTEFHPAGALKFYGVAERESPETLYKESRFDNFGVKLFEIRREADKKIETNFDRQGQKSYSTTTFADGSFGLISYYANGQIKSEKLFAPDKTEKGLWKEYDEDGTLQSEVQK